MLVSRLSFARNIIGATISAVWRRRFSYFSMKLREYDCQHEIRSVETAFLVALNKIARNTIGDDEIRSLETAFLVVRKRLT